MNERNDIMLHGYFDLPTITFFTQGNIWTGSLYTNFNYRIIPIDKKGDENTEPLKELHSKVWYGTDSYPSRTSSYTKISLVLKLMLCTRLFVFVSVFVFLRVVRL